MSTKSPIPSPDLDRVAAGIRDQTIAPEAVQAAADRVRAELGFAEVASVPGTISSCDEFQALLPAFTAGTLAPARAMLVRDHVNGCVPCRRALKSVRDGVAVARSAEPPSRSWLRAAAAAVLISAGLGSLWLVNQLGPGDARAAAIESLDGTLMKLDANGFAPLAIGATVAAGDIVRTDKDSSAFVRMADGSVIEMAPRTEISLHPRRGGTTVELASGNMIIHAAKQRDGHLYAKTQACLVSVTGTVFAVSHGTKGSRVSVIEGRVEVDDGAGEHVLTAGDQVSTSATLDRIPVAEDIAWSRKLDEHLAVLGELSAIGRAIDEEVQSPSARRSSQLLARLPADTVVFAAVPNLSQSVTQAFAVFQERLSQSPTLSEWWNEGHASGDTMPIEQILARVRDVGSLLGDEIVVAARMDENGRPHGHFLLAEVDDETALRAVLEASLSDVSRGGHDPHLAIVSDPRDLVAAGGRPRGVVWIHDGLVTIAGSGETLSALAQDPSMTGGGFLTTPFAARIQDTYRDGVSWVLAADMRSILERKLASADGAERAALIESGLADLEYVVLDQRIQDGQAHKHAVLSFAETRRGLASWLAAPAPMPSLSFLSPDASAFAAFVVKNPAAMVDDLLGVIENKDPDVRQRLARFEAEQGVHLRDDIAGALGGEIMVALDGPMLPTPAWKAAIEVYNPVALQRSIEWLVEHVNAKAGANGGGNLELTEDTVEGRPFYVLRASEGQRSHEVHYTFVDGYLLLGADRAALTRATRYRDSGRNLATSGQLAALYPANGYANFSALVYQNLQALVAPLAEHVMSSEVTLSDEQRTMLQGLAADAAPMLFYAYAHDDRIEVAGSNRAGLFGIDFRSLLSLNGLATLAARAQHGAPWNSTDTDERMLREGDNP